MSLEVEPTVRTSANGNTYLSLSSDDKVVTATPFLPWTERAARAELPTHIGIYTFTPLCSLCHHSLAAGELDDISALTFNLQAHFWARLLTQLTEQGIFDDTITDEHALYFFPSRISLLHLL